MMVLVVHLPKVVLINFLVVFESLALVELIDLFLMSSWVETAFLPFGMVLIASSLVGGQN